MILLQIVMVSPGTHLMKNHDSDCQSRTNASQLKKKELKLKMLGLLCNQTVNLKTDSKTLYYSILKLKYSPPIKKKHNKQGKNKYASFNNSNNNFHKNYMNWVFLQRHRFRSINQLIFASYGMRLWCHELFCVFGDFYAPGTQDAVFYLAFSLWTPAH